MIEAQIIQESLQEIVVKYVPAASFNQTDAKELSNRIRERMGDVQVKLEKVAQIPRTERGKFRAVVCKLPQAERELNSGAERHNRSGYEQYQNSE